MSQNTQTPKAPQASTEKAEITNSLTVTDVVSPEVHQMHMQQLEQLGLTAQAPATKDSKMMILVVGTMAFIFGAILLVTQYRASQRLAQVEQALVAKTTEADAAGRTLTNLQAHVNKLESVIETQARQLKVSESMIAAAKSSLLGSSGQVVSSSTPALSPGASQAPAAASNRSLASSAAKTTTHSHSAARMPQASGPASTHASGSVSGPVSGPVSGQTRKAPPARVPAKSNAQRARH
jgi:hypothetical protein